MSSAKICSRPRPGTEALEHLLKTEVAVVLIDVCMPDLDGFQLAAMIREHPRFQKTAMIFISAIHPDRRGPAARLRDGRGRLCSGAGDSRGAAGQGQDFRRALPQDAAARAHERRARRAGRRAHRRARSLDRAAAAKRGAEAWRSPPARWAPGIGIARPANACGTTGQYGIFGVEPQHFRVDRRKRARR